MGNGQPWKCDMCNTPKKETNHWFIGRVVMDQYETYLKIVHFKEFNAKLTGRVVLCGEGCVHKFVSQSLLGINPTREVS